MRTPTNQLVQVADLAPGHARGGVYDANGIFPTVVSSYDYKANYSYIIEYEEIDLAK